MCTKEKEIDEMHVSIGKLDKCIFGNGNPKSGLQWKIESNTEFIDGCKRMFWIIVGGAMLGAGSAVVSLILTIIRLSNGKIGL